MAFKKWDIESGEQGWAEHRLVKEHYTILLFRAQRCMARYISESKRGNRVDKQNWDEWVEVVNELFGHLQPKLFKNAETYKRVIDTMRAYRKDPHAQFRPGALIDCTDDLAVFCEMLGLTHFEVEVQDPRTAMVDYILKGEQT